MESNYINRILTTGLKSVEIDEINTNDSNEFEGLEYLHEFIILIRTVNEGFFNLQEEMDNIIITNTTHDIELIQL
jgi:hypothetical protein